MTTGLSLLEHIRSEFYGARTHYPLVDGGESARIYLDSAASCLMMKPALDASLQFLDHYANTHSNVHRSAHISNGMYQWAHNQVLEFLDADPDIYTCIFLGSGSTAATNRVARILRAARPNKPGALVSLMEHHSNDLPHRHIHEFVAHILCEGSGASISTISLEDLERGFSEHPDQINYVAVTAASNVTGIVNPIYDVAKIAHDNDALVVVDASQILAHKPFRMTPPSGDAGDALDVVVFSGHKVYAPGSPGVLVIRKTLLDRVAPVELGGGMVERVFQSEFVVSPTLPDREEAGTPNIFGAVNLAFSLQVLSRIGMETIEEHEQRLIRTLFKGLTAIAGLTIYGDNDLTRYPRTATIAFNLKNVDHGLLAAILNDYFNIAVRNECFCAHPYVREMIIQQLWDADPNLDDQQIEAKKGMVRASFALNNDVEDVHRLLAAVSEIASNKAYFLSQYEVGEDLVYRHRTAANEWTTYFSPENALNSALQEHSVTSLTEQKDSRLKTGALSQQCSVVMDL